MFFCVLGMAQLVNCFAVVGLTSDDLRTYASKDDFLANTYTPKVLSHFSHDKNFDDNAICTMCLPDGLHLKQTLFPEDEKPEFHSFLITKEDGSRTYGCAVSFYEVNTDQKLLDVVKNQEQIAENALIVSESDESLQKRGGSLCVQKCICFTSSFPHVSPLKQYLLQLHKTTVGEHKLSVPFETYLSNLLYDVPAPLPGKSIQFHAPLSKLTCKMPSILDFPLCDYPLLSLVQKIGLKNLVKVFTCVLLEHQLLIKSANYSELMECSEWLTALLCPFTWQHVYVPILPASQYMFLDAPVPYIMGLKAGYDFSPEVDITNEGSLCMLDLNRGNLEVPEELPVFPELENFLGRLQEVAESHNVDCTDLREFSLSPTQSHNQPCVMSWLQSYFKGDKKTNSSEEIVKLAGIATRAGIKEEVTSPASSVTSDLGKPTSLDHDEFDGEKFILDIREAFIQRFVDLFRDYEKFTIYPKQNYDQWKRDREQFQNFDRTAFLSDQPEKHLPFLSAFLETQMFRAFIDEKIESYYSKEPAKCLSLFDNKIETAIKERSDLMRSPVFEKAPVLLEDPCSPTYDSAPIIIEIPPPTPKPLEDEVCFQPLGVFPNPDLTILKRQRASSPSLQENTGTLEKKRLRRSFVPNEPSSSRQIIARHAKFVMQLWRESRVRVKNMVGSSPNAKSSVEENTQIANLCDLLERIWSHGLVVKKDGKSPLWSHLMAYAETDTTYCEPVSSGASPTNSGNQVRSTSPKAERMPRSLTPTQNFKVQLRRKSLQSPELRERVSALLSPPTVFLIDDILTIKMMTEIKTDVGRTRAWVRLALEKKLLYKHLVELLSNKTLLEKRYKDYAFLRTEDEKEQFLLHMLTLSAKDFSSFTRGFKDSSMLYRVLVVGEGKHFGLSTACLYCNLAGKYNNSGTTWFSKGEYTLDIKCQNLGPITCIRIGHDNSGLAASTWIDSVLVQNTTTGHTYHFPCHQWLSRAEGDCSTERFLVAKKLDYNPMTSPPSVDSIFSAENSKKKATRKDSKDPILSVEELNHNLTAAIQNIVGSSFNDSNNEQLNFLLGPDGLVYCLEQVLSFGMSTSRKSRKPFLWDLVEKMSTKITCMHETDKAAAEKLLSVVISLQNQATGTGKVERFHTLVCAGISNQLLVTWIKLLATSSATTELYAPGSYLLNQQLLAVLTERLQELLTVQIYLPALLLESS